MFHFTELPQRNLHPFYKLLSNRKVTKTFETVDASRGKFSRKLIKNSIEMWFSNFLHSRFDDQFYLETSIEANNNDNVNGNEST